MERDKKKKKMDTLPLSGPRVAPLPAPGASVKHNDKNHPGESDQVNPVDRWKAIRFPVFTGWLKKKKMVAYIFVVFTPWLSMQWCLCALTAAH